MAYIQQPGPVIVQQPIPTQVMTINPKNSLNKPDVGGQGRDWSNGLCACTNVGTCLLAWCLPCIVYGSNKQRVSHLERTGTPDPEHGGVCNSDCMVYGAVAACLGIACVLQVGNRTNLRRRYGIRGGGCSDCMVSCCCIPCALSQEEAEIELEERAVAQLQGGYTKA
ncbi:hypothetical protein H0H93_012136 [Arthromyces matolae]|nr:hypothetical protein H0H93_012136 [Arthromyces matolae]